jgi:hypothetical protein
MAKYLERRGREFWEQMILEFDQLQDVTQQQFAESKGVKVATFRQWIYRLRQERTQSDSSERAVARTTPATGVNAHFFEVEVDVTPLVRVRMGVVIVEFSAVPPPAWVAELAAYGGF